MTFKLHSSTVGQGPPIVLLHGLFGMGSNLGALARALQDRYTVHSIDLPNHGRSAWLESADIPRMADCVLAWLDDKQFEQVAMVGHSLGGKVSMELALQQPQRVNALVAADVAPVDYPPHHDQIFVALEAVTAANCESRTQAGAIMAELLDEDMVVQFLLMSLYRGPEGTYRWRFNLAEIIRSYPAIRAGQLAQRPYDKPVLFVKGGDSDYIQETHRATIAALFSQVSLKLMPGCGHWLHAQQPRLFNSIVGRFLDRALAD